MRGKNPTPEQIREFRHVNGLTQTQAGRLVHRPLRNWQQWEAGDRRMCPALWELAQIKMAKGCERCGAVPAGLVTWGCDSSWLCDECDSTEVDALRQSAKNHEFSAKS